jgi:hypothetical protein
VTARRFLNNDDAPKELPGTENMRKKLEAALGYILEKGGNPDNEDWFADIHASPKYGTSIKKDEIGCLTRARAGAYGPWNTRLGRFLRPSEMARFQGFKISKLVWKDVASQFQLCQALGNAWPINVAARVLLNCCRAIQLDREGMRDPFAKAIRATSSTVRSRPAANRATSTKKAMCTMKRALKRPSAAAAKVKK